MDWLPNGDRILRTSSGRHLHFLDDPGWILDPLIVFAYIESQWNMGTLLLHFVVIIVAVNKISCQLGCHPQALLEWNPKKQTVQMNWTLVGNICKNRSDCFGAQEGDGWSRHLSFPQICPLQLQFGDKLLMTADGTLESYGIRILNVSKENFDSCSTDGQENDQFLFPFNINGSAQVGVKWLFPGHHYFIALHEGDTQLCKLGLRLNVSVKMQLCQSSPLLRLCSGNGICQTDLWEGAYHCRCHRNYSGRFCEKFDACLDNPCKNKGVCLSNGSTDPTRKTHKCLCPPHFTGKDKKLFNFIDFHIWFNSESRKLLRQVYTTKAFPSTYIYISPNIHQLPRLLGSCSKTPLLPIEEEWEDFVHSFWST